MTECTQILGLKNMWSGPCSYPTTSVKKTLQCLMITATLSCPLPATSNNSSLFRISTPCAGICPGLSSNAPVSGDAPLRQPWMSTGSGGLPILSGLSQGGCGDGGQSGGQTGGTSGLGGGGTRLNPPPGFNFTGGYTPITAVGPRVGNEGFFEGGGGRGQSGSRTTSGGKRDSWATGPHSETPNPLVSNFQGGCSKAFAERETCGFARTLFQKTLTRA